MYVLDFSFNFLREDKRNVKKRRKRRPMGTDPETHRSQWDRPRDTQEPMGQTQRHTGANGDRLPTKPTEEEFDGEKCPGWIDKG